MKKIVSTLLYFLMCSLATAGNQIGDYKFQSITYEKFIERKQEILLIDAILNYQLDDTIYVMAQKYINGWGVTQSEFFNITLETHVAHPSIILETTISDLESGRKWIKREAWSAADIGVVREWLQH